MLINDGSTDRSLEICQKWAADFPRNIQVIDKKNEGVSVARNVGFAASRGRYVNFFDSDDRWSLDWCEEAFAFFVENPGIGIVGARHTFFGAQEGPHLLSWKYKSDGVVDIDKSPDKFLLTVNNLFIRRNLVEPFLPGLEVSEDFRNINEVISKTRKYGVLSVPRYWYRRRTDGSSAINLSTTNRSFYLKSPVDVYEYLFDSNRNLDGSVPRFLQNAVMYDLQWRVKREKPACLSEEELATYIETLAGLLKDIDDSVILSQKNIFREHKLYCLALKYGLSFGDARESLSADAQRNLVMFRPRSSSNEPLGFYRSRMDSRAMVLFTNITDSEVLLEGRILAMLPRQRVRVYAKSIDGNTYHAHLYDDPTSDVPNPSGSEAFKHISFSILLPLADCLFYIELDDGVERPLELTPGRFSKLTFNVNSYYWTGSWILTTPARNHFCVERASARRILELEAAYERWLLTEKHVDESLIDLRADTVARRIANKEGRHTALISDRPSLAGDNGEAIFKYLSGAPSDLINPVFVLHEDSPDFSRLSDYGRVVAFGSREHLSLHLEARFLVSSAADLFVYDPFGSTHFAVQDLEHYSFVFLQHGVTMNDLSSWLARRNKNIKLFVTSAQREYNSIVNNPKYGYSADVVKLTGLPRHDYLLSEATADASKTLLIAPTWRNYLALPFDKATGHRPANPAFSNSAYFIFYQKLLNDKRVLAAAKAGGWSVRFLVHPAFQAEADKFSSSVTTIVTDYNYRSEFVNAGILVSDYSSVVFDFALLRKPIIYAQADRDDFYARHLFEPGYFSFDRDGFGPVTKSYEETVNEILRYMDSPFMEQRYVTRVNDFYNLQEGEGMRDSAAMGQFRRCAAVVAEIERLGAED